jgi:hypothetical protein
LTGNKTTQNFACSIDTNIPTLFNSALLGTLNVVNALNAQNGTPLPFPVGILTLDAALTVALTEFQTIKGLDITEILVTGSKWVNNNGKARLTFNASVTSDPITTADLAAIIIAAFIVIVVIIDIELGVISSGLGTIIIVAIGGLILGVVLVSEIGSMFKQVFSTPLGSVAVIAGIVGITIIGYVYLKEPKRRATAKRYVGKAASAGKRVGKRAAKYTVATL